MPKMIDLTRLNRAVQKLKALISNKADANLSNVPTSDFATKMLEHNANAIYTATSTDGVAYSVTVPGVTSLYAGLQITIKPGKLSASTTPTLNVNGLGAKGIRQPLSTNNVATAPGTIATWLSTNNPIRLTYSGSVWKTEFYRPSSSTLYGTMAIDKGGTGGTTAETALANLGGASLAYVNEQLTALSTRISALENK